MRKRKGSHAFHPNLLATSFFVDTECNNNCSPRGKPCFKQGFQGRAGSSTSNSVAKRLSNTTEPTGYQLIHSYRQRYLARRQSLLCAVSRGFAVAVPAAYANHRNVQSTADTSTKRQYSAPQARHPDALSRGSASMNDPNLPNAIQDYKCSRR